MALISAKFPNVICVSTLYDPESRLLYLVKEYGVQLPTLFSKMIVVCTQSTGESIISEMKSHKLQVIMNGSSSIADKYQNALQAGIESIDTKEDVVSKRIFYCDFDRLLHWISNYPSELSDLMANNQDVEYLHIGRTKRAFNTHPITQVKTEKIVNELATQMLGFDELFDDLSASWMMSPRLAQKVISLKNPTSTGFYASWPIYLWHWAESKRFKRVEGHEWETPDRYQTEIKEMGFDKWSQQFQSSEEWERRADLLNDCLFEMYQLGRFRLKEEIDF
jgi:hypothetical protein